MTDETTDPGGEPNLSETTASEDLDASAWADGLLERARARSSGEPIAAEDPTETVEGVIVPPAAPVPGEPTWETPPARAPIVTRADMTGRGQQVAAPLEGTFDLPVTPPWSGPPPTPLTVGDPMGTLAEVDLGIPGRIVSARRSVIEWGSVLIGALVLAMIVRTFLFQAFYIPSPSMEPTLWSGDRILVNKLSYQLHDVNRGDLVVFRSSSGGTSGDDLIKRVIALPGERVTAEGGRLLIGGGLLIEPYLPFREGTADFGLVPWCTEPELGACTVPDGHVFVMGDNRSNSRDSRFFGPVPIESIIGRAFVRVWPLGALDRL